MISVTQRRKVVKYTALFGVLFLVVGGLFALSPKAHAGGAWGNSGGTGSGSGVGYYTSNGFGWKLFDVSGGGPSGGFRTDSWGNVQAQCQAVGDQRVWVHVIRNSGGGEKSYSYIGAGYNPNRPAAGSDPYDYNAYGQYIGHGPAAYSQSVIGIVTLVDSYYIQANPSNSGWGSTVGWFCFNEGPTWTIGVGASANKTTAAPGDTITWTHTVTNNGPLSTTSNVTYHYQNRQDLGNGQGPDSTFSSGSPNGKKVTFTSTYTVTQADVNKTLCRATSASPPSSNGSNWTESSAACVSVPYSYALIPDTVLGSNNAVEAQSVLSVNPTVQNTGVTQSNSTQWQLTQIVVQPGNAVPNAAGGMSSSTVNPCGTYFKGTGAVCSTVSSGTSVFDTNGAVLSGSALGPVPVTIGDLPVGTKVCFAFSVQPESNTTTNWRHSAPKCVTVGKRPKIQIHGGDLIVGRSFDGLSAPSSPSVVNTSTSVKSINGKLYTFGSWIEYGIFAVGTVNGAGSGSAFAGSGLQGATVCDYSTLTFVNATTSNPATDCSDTGTIGGYSMGQSIPNVAANFPISSATPVYNDAAANPQGVYQADANNDPITVSAKNIAKGEWVVINAPNADVTITGDIKYDSASDLESISDIPQMVIIAKDIYIAPGVQQVDSWLIAQGSQTANTGILDTCQISSDYTTPQTVSTCNTILQVNGPVMAQHLWLRRTGGSGTGSSSGDPAEVFNLRPDAYLWSYARASVTGRIDTVYIQELPPRF